MLPLYFVVASGLTLRFILCFFSLVCVAFFFAERFFLALAQSALKGIQAGRGHVEDLYIGGESTAVSSA